MRDSSPTGGALGQVSEHELYLLMAARQALIRFQTEGQLSQNLHGYADMRRLAIEISKLLTDKTMGQILNRSSKILKPMTP